MWAFTFSRSNFPTVGWSGQLPKLAGDWLRTMLNVWGKIAKTTNTNRTIFLRVSTGWMTTKADLSNTTLSHYYFHTKWVSLNLPKLIIFANARKDEHHWRLSAGKIFPASEHLLKGKKVNANAGALIPNNVKMNEKISFDEMFQCEERTTSDTPTETHFRSRK